VAAQALSLGDPQGAVDALASALEVPVTLGEAPHPLANRSDLLLAYGDANQEAGNRAEAEAAWQEAAHSVGDFTTMTAVPHSPMTYFSLLAAQRLGDTQRVERLTSELAAYVEERRGARVSIDYFATSLPSMLIFREDIEQTHRELVTLMDAELALLAGDRTTARSLLSGLEARNPANTLARSLLREAEAAFAA
jgi:hypothetical protein